MVPTITPLLQPPDGDLEEGEICQKTLKDTKLSQPPLGIEFVSPTAEEQKHDKNEAQSAAFEDDSKESNPAAPSESTVTGVIDLAEVSTGSVEDGLVSAAADGGHSGILLNDSEKDSGNVITTLSTLTDTGSAVVSVETHGAGNSEEHNTNHPVEEQERENPFFLVRNRKSGRKAAKHL